jgi:DNA mismatch repair protein MutS
MAISPMMQQYHDAKQACGDALLLFRMGDFYELFHDDAKTASRILGLTLTSRDKGENPIPMAGFPYHQLEGYLAKLINTGLRAAVCEQVEDPKQAKGLVKREITRVVSPGTLTDDALLDPLQNNYLAAVALPADLQADDAMAGVAWAELSTGRFFAAVTLLARVNDEIARIGPVECLLADDAEFSLHLTGKGVLTRRPSWAFSHETGGKALARHFQTASLDGFGFTDDDGPAIRAAGAILDYLQETQKTSLEHIDRLLPYRSGQSLEIDEATRRSLELTRTLRSGSRDGSLLSAIDRTTTPMGGRLLADWLASPLTDKAQIEARLDAVGELARESSLRDDLREQLRGVYDLQRLLARVATGRCTPRDLSFVGRTLASLPKLKAKLTARKSSLLGELEIQLDLCPEIRSQLEAALLDDCPLQAKDGGLIREGFNPELDKLRDLAAGGKQWIAKYQADEAARTGIPNLKVAFNKVFGYYIEITNSHKDKTPANYHRKQTTTNAERYVTPELKEYEEQVLTADERAKTLEYELFLQLREVVQAATRRLQGTAAALAQIDVLASLAQLACQRNYCRPVVTDEPLLQIIDGRHPVLDVIETQGTFVPNDARCGGDDGLVILITGPNMAGKSTYIRQVALLTVMAQIGSFVPANSATIGIADRVFARVGASDELSRGQSTFMVEMTETARILNTATQRSLVVLDEIGRGTSTYDGISLAWAIVEHLHDATQCRTFFATHYHELTDLAGTMPGVRNLSVAVKEWEEHIIFLHKIVPGAADKSYGIHVARLAGIPRSVNERAKQILSQLEQEHLDPEGKSKLAIQPKTKRRGDLQLTLFAPEEHPVVDKLRQLDLNHLTPLAALQLLGSLQQEVSGGAPLKPR